MKYLLKINKIIIRRHNEIFERLVFNFLLALVEKSLIALQKHSISIFLDENREEEKMYIEYRESERVSTKEGTLDNIHLFYRCEICCHLLQADIESSVSAESNSQILKITIDLDVADADRKIWAL